MNIHTTGYATHLQVQTKGPGKVIFLTAHNKHATANAFLLLFEGRVQPANGAVPLWAPIPLKPPGSDGQYFALVGDWTFTDGLWIMGSTTAATLTLAGADLWIDAKLA